MKRKGFANVAVLAAVVLCAFFWRWFPWWPDPHECQQCRTGICAH